MNRTHHSRLTTHAILLCLLLIAHCQFAKAQTIEEWTQQKQTAIKRLVEQIIANKVFLESLKTGYKVVSGGLNVISEIKEGDLKLHFFHFDSLKLVHPQIKNSAKVTAIIAMQVRLLQWKKLAMNNTDQFTNEEQRYIRSVWNKVLEEALATLDALMNVITSGELSMTDDQRMQRINSLYEDMQEHTNFAASFHQQVQLLSVQRAAEKNELDHQRSIHNH